MEHFLEYCLFKPTDASTPKGKASLNTVLMIPSQTTSETKSEVVPLRVITRSHQKNDQIQTQLIKRSPRVERAMREPKEVERFLRIRDSADIARNPRNKYDK